MAQQDNKINLFDKLKIVVAEFAPQAQAIDIQAFGSGNINDTFWVSWGDKKIQSFILQRINHQVFCAPQLVMQNMRIYNDHVRDRLAKSPLDRRWEMPQILATAQGQDYLQTEDGEFWRSLSFIDNSKSYNAITNSQQAREVGYTLGMFHHLTSDLAPQKLVDTLEGFHITPLYLQQYEQAIARGKNTQTSPEINYCQKIIDQHKKLVHLLEDAKASGKLPLRVMHGDPKVNNILFDQNTQLAVSIVDLDTVKSGLIHYDIGDCLRSGCNPAGEDIRKWEDVRFDMDLAQETLAGYKAIANSFLTKTDNDYIFDAVRVITFELGLRFFTDYLAGNVYFHVKYPEHNLLRSLVQFRLLESLESQIK